MVEAHQKAIEVVVEVAPDEPEPVKRSHHKKPAPVVEAKRSHHKK